MVTVGIAQFKPVHGDLQSSINKLERIIAEAAHNNVQVLVFGETWLCGYPAPQLALVFTMVSDNSDCIAFDNILKCKTVMHKLVLQGSTSCVLVANKDEWGFRYN